MLKQYLLLAFLKGKQRLAWVVYGIGLGKFRSGPIHSTQLLKVRG
jgi:hypothetical protein